MYTSGWPKNQNRCWNSTGSPPPSAEKKVVPKLRSVSSMVMAPASTGSDSSSRNTVTRIDHTNSGILCRVMPGARMLKIVVMKLMAPRIDEAPARCSDRIAKSTAGPGMARGRQRRVHGPARADAVGARLALDEGRDQQQREGGRQQPERDVVHARERHVGRADHQRHEPVAEAADHRRHHHEEDHDQAVRGHEHVVGMGLVEDLDAGIHQLDADHDRHRRADDARDDREHQVHRADVLVVGRIDEAPPSGRMVVRVIVMGVIGRVSLRLLPCFKSCLAVPFGPCGPVALVPSCA